MPTNLESIVVTAAVFLLGGLIGWSLGWAFYPHETKHEGASDEEPFGEASTYRQKVRW